MYTIDFNKPVHIYFMGIGGISMSGLAHILIEKGFKVSGSDSKESAMTRTLSDNGVTVFYGQCAENIENSEHIDAVVYTAAVHPDNPEFIAVKNAGIPMLTRAELLGQIMKEYKLPVAISGTHGKTTTTSMTSMILDEGGFDPTIVIGGKLKNLKTNARLGKGEYIIAEADESDGSDCQIYGKIVVASGIDPEKFKQHRSASLAGHCNARAFQKHCSAKRRISQAFFIRCAYKCNDFN